MLCLMTKRDGNFSMDTQTGMRYLFQYRVGRRVISAGSPLESFAGKTMSVRKEIFFIIELGGIRMANFLGWKRGDWGAYFGLLINNLTNFFLVGSVMINRFGYEASFFYSRVAPGFGLAVLLAGIFYWLAAKNLVKKTGRDDVTALPSGPSAPSIFIILYSVMSPMMAQYGLEGAWQIALGWCFLESLVEMSGAFIGNWIRRIIPRPILLAALGGLGIMLLAMNPILQSFENPLIAFIVLALIFANWFGKKPLFPKIPTGFLLLASGTILAWVFGKMNGAALAVGAQQIGFHIFVPQLGALGKGMGPALMFIASAIPLGITNFIFTLENIEAAAAAGDEYNTRNIMLANGVSSMVGCLCGNPFPTTVYIGHTGWKSIGASCGYTLASAFTVFVITIFGLGGIFTAVIPEAAIVPILFYVGIVSAKQAVTETKKEEIAAVFVAFFPWIANWAYTLVKNVCNAVAGGWGSVSGQLLNGSLYIRGLETLGSGNPLSSLIWGCMAIFAIRGENMKAVISACIGALFTFVGLIHAGQLSININEMFFGYLIVAAVFVLKHFTDSKSDKPTLDNEKVTHG